MTSKVNKLLNNVSKCYLCSRIPLVPRRPVSPDTAGTGKGGKQDKAKGKKEAGADLPDGMIPPTDLDEKLLFDAHLLGVVSIDRMVSYFCNPFGIILLIILVKLSGNEYTLF